MRMHGLQISQVCQELLAKLLQSDPLRSVTKAGVLDHPWFNTNLPPLLLTLNARQLCP